MIRQTKIVCTLGPASQSAEVIQNLVQNGMNIARINMSHGDKEQYAEFIKTVRSINEHKAVPIGIMLDTKGAEIRTGERQNPLKVETGDTVRFCLPNTISNYPETEKCIEVSYDAFTADVQETNQILVDSGEIAFSITSIEDDGSVLSKAKQSGSIGSRRHINLFGAVVDLPTITDKDWQDIAFAVEQKVDFLALSFIRTAADIEEVRSYLQTHHSGIKIIAKIETKQAVDNIIEIIDACDAVMIARGDLGAEIPYEQLPSVQDRITTLCQDSKKPVIVATQMLESMIKHPMPTRAEIVDVAHAAMIQADATMLSGETASGIHPALVVEAMSKILVEAETGLLHNTAISRRVYEHDKLDSISSEILKEAYRQRVDCIVLDTNDCNKVLTLAKQRPMVPIIHTSMPNNDQGLLALTYGVHSYSLPNTSAQVLAPVLRELLAVADEISAFIVQWNSELPSHGVITV